jgi:UDP-N-acetylmuramoyl-tripeptide--D-alanyl-D-alanine ligase
MDLYIGQEDFHVTTTIAGDYNYENCIAAAAVGDHFEVPTDLIASAIAEYRPQNTRSQIVTSSKNMLLLDYYNANPTSMSEALKNFLLQTDPKKMVILGDMFELGEATNIEHANIIELLTTQDITSIFVGEYFCNAATSVKTTNDKMLFFTEIEKLKNWLKNEPIEDFFILLKGSRGMKLEQLVGYL